MLFVSKIALVSVRPYRAGAECRGLFMLGKVERVVARSTVAACVGRMKIMKEGGDFGAIHMLCGSAYERSVSGKAVG